jgi:Outer membrane protein transport protein (OMPP1/FadL/TodX)
VKGDGNFTLDAAGTGQRLVNATCLFQDTNFKANVTTPETASFGIYHDISPEWAIMGEAAWTRWSRFRHLTDNPAQPNSVTDEDWNDTWFFAAGLTWRPDERWTLRGGAAFDQDPSRNRTHAAPSDKRPVVALARDELLALGLRLQLHTRLLRRRVDRPEREQPGNPSASAGRSGRAIPASAGCIRGLATAFRVCVLATAFRVCVLGRSSV